MAIKSVKKAKRRIFVYYLCVIGILIALMFTLPNYMYQILSKNHELKNYQDELVYLQKQEQELHTEVLQLQDPTYVEMIARQKYLFSKDGELIIKIEKAEVDEVKDEFVFDFTFVIKIVAIIVIVLLIFSLLKILYKRRKQKRMLGKHGKK